MLELYYLQDILTNKKYNTKFFNELEVDDKLKHLRDVGVRIAIFYFLESYCTLPEILQGIMVFTPYEPRLRAAPLVIDVTLYGYGVKRKFMVKPEFIVKPILVIKSEFIVSLPIATKQSLGLIKSLLDSLLHSVLASTPLLQLNNVNFFWSLHCLHKIKNSIVPFLPEPLKGIFLCELSKTFNNSSTLSMTNLVIADKFYYVLCNAVILDTNYRLKTGEIKRVNVIKQFHSDLKDILSLAVKALGAEKKYQNGTYTQYDTRWKSDEKCKNYSDLLLCFCGIRIGVLFYKKLFSNNKLLSLNTTLNITRDALAQKQGFVLNSNLHFTSICHIKLSYFDGSMTSLIFCNILTASRDIDSIQEEWKFDTNLKNYNVMKQQGLNEYPLFLLIR